MHYLMMSKGNKVNFTHIIVNCMGKRHVDFFKKNASPFLHDRAYFMTPIFKERGGCYLHLPTNTIL